jgi:hypothetical protein
VTSQHAWLVVAPDGAALDDAYQGRQRLASSAAVRLK